MNFTAITWADKPATTSPINASNLNRIDSGIAALYKLTASVTHDITTDADYTLTAAQDAYGRIVITDTGVVLTTGRNIILATAVERSMFFQNDTAQALTLKTSAGAGIAVAAGQSKQLFCDGTNVVTPATDAEGLTASDIGVTVQAYDVDTTKNDVNNVFTVGQRTTETAVTWSTTPNLDMNKADFYIDCTAATGEMAFTATNIPGAGTNQGGVITFLVNATYQTPTWSADFVNTPTDISTTGTLTTVAYMVVRGKIVLGAKVGF